MLHHLTKYYSITRSQLFSATKSRHVAECRFVYFYLLYCYKSMKQKDIALIFGYNPSNVSTGINRVFDMIKYDAIFKCHIQKIVAKVTKDNMVCEKIDV